jgi:hypothetical protein
MAQFKNCRWLSPPTELVSKKSVTANFPIRSSRRREGNWDNVESGPRLTVVSFCAQREYLVVHHPSKIRRFAEGCISYRV